MPARRPSRRAVLAAGATLLAGCQAPARETTESPPPTSVPPSATDSPDPTTTEPTESPGTPPDADLSWPTFNHDPANTGASPESPGPPTEPRGDWRTDVAGQFTLNQPAVVGDLVVLGSKHAFYGMNRVTGSLRWETEVEQFAHHFSPAIVDDQVIALDRGRKAGVQGGSDPGSVRALRTDDGSVRWRERAHPTASPTVVDGTVYLANTGDGTAYALALDAGDGSQDWQQPLPCGGGEVAALATPAVADGTVYFGLSCSPEGSTREGALVALDAASGAEQWRRTLPAPVQAAPVVADGHVLVADFDGTVHALDPGDGSETWRTDTPGPAYTAPSATDGAVFVLTGGGIERLGTDGGEQAWRHELENVNISGIAVARSTLYVGGNPLVALSTDSGEPEWSVPVAGAAGAWGAPAVVGDALYAGSCIKPETTSLYDNYLYALR